jgi:hypothetical protein
MPSAQNGPLERLTRERDYWRGRLRALELQPPGLILTQRPDLSTRVVEVAEFRVRAHDGLRLWGLRAASRLGSTSARVRVVGPSDLPRVDLEAVAQGVLEIVLQAPPGRRLQDRVLDVLRVRQLAQEAVEGPAPVELGVEPGRRVPDEFLIASQLLAEAIHPHFDDQDAGWAGGPGPA